jgi:arginyl-tRNA synthetase
LTVAALIKQALAGLGVNWVSFVLEHAKVASHDDLARNVAMKVAKSPKKNPREVGQSRAG